MITIRRMPRFGSTHGHRLAVLISMCLVGSVVVANPASAAESWSAASSLSLGRSAHRATLLADGRVLVTGGNTVVGNGYDTKLAEIYSPSTNGWSSTGSTTNGRSGHTATRLKSGKVLVTGGVNANVCTFDTTAEVYNPATGTWSFTGSLSAARYFSTATLLNDGKVLVTGGGNRCGTVFSSAEVYNPRTGTWSSTGSMTTPREFHDAIRLADGRVLAVGGATPGGCCPFPTVSSAEIYDPATGLWSPTGSMATERAHPTLALLADGRVMATGGYTQGPGFGIANGPPVEIFDPATGIWTATGSLSVGRASGSLTLLTNGLVLAVGGTDGTTVHASSELWNPSTGTWSASVSMVDSRLSFTATLLKSGKVLVASGQGASCCLTSAELYRKTAR